MLPPETQPAYNAAKECGSKGITIDLETRSMKMSVD